MAKQLSDIQLKKIVEGALRGKPPLGFKATIAKVEKTFRTKIGRSQRKELMKVYDEVRHEVAMERKRSAGLKLCVIGGFFSVLAAFFFIAEQYDLPMAMKVTFLVIGLPAWFLGLQTLFTPVKTQPMRDVEVPDDEGDGGTKIIED